MDPTLQNILDQQSLKWIFVGGKGGVGKTTNSCSLAVQLSAVRDSVLLISTDPAHNLSDAFAQKFGKDPILVNSFKNLYAMEIDPNAGATELGSGANEMDPDSPLGSMFGELSSALPGIDEAMGFAQVMKFIKNMQYSVIVFDTAPTGHTLRFLQFPSLLERALNKFQSLSGRLGGMLGQVGAMMGMPGLTESGLTDRLKDLSSVVSEVNRQFTNPKLTTFICVCIAEFLSLYETERMIQELASYGIDVHNVIVNQLIFPGKQSRSCPQCQARRRMQKKYLDQIEELYEDFHVVKLPLLTQEVRGGEAIRAFSKMLIEPVKYDGENDDASVGNSH